VTDILEHADVKTAEDEVTAFHNPAAISYTAEILKKMRPLPDSRQSK
jgi:hypothetical protein